jgi:hypothetical protein
MDALQEVHALEILDIGLGLKLQNWNNNFPDYYVLDNGDSYSRLPSDVDQVVRLFRSDILVIVLLPMLIDYFNDSVRARSLGIAAQIKIMGEPSLVYTGLWFGSIRLPSEKYKIMSWKKKEFKDLEDLVVYFRFYFVIGKIPVRCNGRRQNKILDKRLVQSKFYLLRKQLY